MGHLFKSLSTAEPPSIFHHADRCQVLAPASSKGHNNSGGAPSHGRENRGGGCALRPEHCKMVRAAGETRQRCSREALQEQPEENEERVEMVTG
ncbi:hypothetical protein SESBI_37649 [Sesbania bispinosa]|nr:hypothetical protein SESBI_37649 [Sesbania bispinosa]